MTFHKIHLPTAAVLFAVMASACNATPDSDPTEFTATAESPIAAYKFGTWSPWTMPVNVCFTKWLLKDNTPTDTQFNDLKALAMTGLQESWGLVPGVSFVNKGNCTSSMSTYLHLEIAWGPGWGGVCGTGVGTTCSLGGGTDNQYDKNFFKAVIAHEVGHGLGLPHEHQRVDANNCNQALVDACNRCKASVDAGQACSAANWNTCVQPDPLVTTAQVFAPGSPQYDKLLEMLGNNGPDSSFALLTPYDPLSIMNYCAGNNGRDQYDDRPTAWDLLGVEMIYPVSSNYRIGCRSGCFSTGTGAITRTDGTVTTDWMARGALSVTMIDPKSGQNVTSTSTASLPTGSSQLTFKFIAPRNGAQLTTSGTLVNDNSAHTSLVNVVVAANL